jgi:hypothetical protein
VGLTVEQRQAREGARVALVCEARIAMITTKRIRQSSTSILSILSAAFLLASCIVRTEEPPDDDDDASTSAMISGKLEVKDEAYFANLDEIVCRVEGADVRVRVETDRTFLLRAVPTGDVLIKCKARDVEFEIELDEVEAGSVVFVIIILDRTPSTVVEERPPGRHMPPPAPDDKGRIEIRDDHAVVTFGAGRIEGSMVITGDHVTVLGLGSSCKAGRHAVLEGDLIIHGDDVVVVGITVLGQITITGKNARVIDDCDADDGGPGSPPRADAGAPPPQHPDAGAPPPQYPDAAPPPQYPDAAPPQYPDAAPPPQYPDAAPPPQYPDAGPPPQYPDAGPPPQYPDAGHHGGGLIEIRDNDVIIWIQAGVHIGSIIILGNNVTVIGVVNSCAAGAHATISGDLVIHGNNATVKDVTVLGRTEITGNNAAVTDDCS